ncbi:MAG: hypothetical protein U0401_09580 [Anaerolineae bacterium]
MIPITVSQPDGLYIPTSATLAQLYEDEPLRDFAAGLLHTAVLQTCNLQPATCNLLLAQALHHPGPEFYPLLTALLALDAEVRATVGNETRVLPLPGFLSYRASLPPDKAPLQAVRLPPLNLGGHYRFFGIFLGDEHGAVRFDLHPALRVAGHMRLALSGPTRFPMRLIPIEERLDRQALTEALIEAAVAVGGEEVSPPPASLEQSRVSANAQFAGFQTIKLTTRSKWLSAVAM